MTNNTRSPTLTALALAAALCGAAPAFAQVAGGTTSVDTATTESTQLALGWSVKKTLLGKAIVNDAGDKVGKIEDLIVSPDRNVTYVIVGAGGFVGIGRHDVAIPVSKLQDKAGRLVMAGATKDMIKAMPEFKYADPAAGRDAFVAAAERDIAAGKARVTDLDKRAGAATAEARAKIAQQTAALRIDLRSAEDRVGEMKRATATRWKEFEAGVTAATARVRKSVEAVVG